MVKYSFSNSSDLKKVSRIPKILKRFKNTDTDFQEGTPPTALYRKSIKGVQLIRDPIQTKEMALSRLSLYSCGGARCPCPQRLPQLVDHKSSEYFWNVKSPN